MGRCRICLAENNLDEKYEIKEMMQGKGDLFSYFLCSDCGCLQIKSFPDNIDLYYLNYYTSGRVWNKTSGFKNKLWAFRSFVSNYKIYSLIEKLRFNTVLHWKSKAGLTKSSKILDVGCGSGDLLFEFRKHGFCNLTGIDPNINESNNNSSIKLFKKTIFELEDKFELIMFNHSYEHIWEQHETIEKARSLLERNGRMIIRVPIINLAFSLYKENWVQIDAPRHFYIHSLKSIEFLCKQHRLEIYYKYFDSSEFQFIGSEQYLKGIALNSVNSYLTNPRNSIFNKKDLKSYRKQAKELNKAEEGDQVVLFIKKIEENYY